MQPEPPAAPAGAMHEQTFNEALADALRQRRQLWRRDPNFVLGERLRMLADAERERPDILVAPPDIYPVIIEVEFGDPGFADARHKLGRLVVGTTDRVRAAIAVGVPDAVREWSTGYLRERLAQPDGVELRLAVLYAGPTGTGEGASIWPAEGYVIGNVDDLAVMCEYASAPPLLVSTTADTVAARIHNLADSLYRSMPPGVAGAIAGVLGQRDERQGLRMACCIWLTSLRLHNLLAVNSSSLRAMDLQTIAHIRATNLGVLSLTALRREWDKILKVNYGSIFSVARTALDDRMPIEQGVRAMEQLAETAENITALRLGNHVDFAGELFPKLLDDREETAAHYTLPETAELLARLAIERIALPDWSDAEAVANLRIADLACGTGTLLRAAYRQIRQRHEAAGGDATNLHQRMMEEAITGLDINALASHMTAAGLSSAELQTEYHHTNIASVAVLGGRTGSLELLRAEQITDVTGEQVTSAAGNGEAREPTMIPVLNHSQDLVIQNPPYSRARGRRRLFDITGIDESQRQRSLRRLSNLRSGLRRSGNEMTDGQAGLGPDFSALANQKLKPGGVLATVLPLTAAHAESWEGFRRTIENEYRDLTVIAFTSHDTYRTAPEQRQQQSVMMSSDTNIEEMLLIATKRGKGDDAPSPIFSVNLSETPPSESESFWYGKLIEGIGEPDDSSGLVYAGRQEIGSWTRTNSPLPGFPWFPVGMRNRHIVDAATELMDGRLHSLSTRQSWNLSLPVTTLDQVVAIGPTHHLIGHLLQASETIGAFTFTEVTRENLPVYPALWAADASNQKRLTVGATHSGEPAIRDEAVLRQILTQRSDLFISRNLWMVSQALAAARTGQLMMGGRGWAALMSDDDGIKSALAIWLNSTLGLLVRGCYAQTTQPGRATMQIRALAGFPVPDFAADSAAGEQARTIARQQVDELAALELQPISYAFRDENRRQFDAVALEMMGLGGNQQAIDAVSVLREQWCREPSVHGGITQVMQALGLR